MMSPFPLMSFISKQNTKRATHFVGSIATQHTSLSWSIRWQAHRSSTHWWLSRSICGLGDIRLSHGLCVRTSVLSNVLPLMFADCLSSRYFFLDDMVICHNHMHISQLEEMGHAPYLIPREELLGLTWGIWMQVQFIGQMYNFSDVLDRQHCRWKIVVSFHLTNCSLSEASTLTQMSLRQWREHIISSHIETFVNTKQEWLWREGILSSKTKHLQNTTNFQQKPLPNLVINHPNLHQLSIMEHCVLVPPWQWWREMDRWHWDWQVSGMGI